MPKMIALTGHRPHRLGGYGPNPVTEWVYRTTVEVLQKLREQGCENVLSGMALGFDQMGARAALELGMKLVAVIPFVGQESVWPPAEREEYRKLLARAAEVMVVTDISGARDPKKAVAVAMETRNRVLIERGDMVVACWDGQRHGGTWHAVQLAWRLGRPTVKINPKTRVVSWPIDRGWPTARMEEV